MKQWKLPILLACLPLAYLVFLRMTDQPVDWVALAVMVGIIGAIWRFSFVTSDAQVQKIDRDFTATVVAGIEASVAQFRQSGPAEEIVGYAICTDDDLMTAFWMAITRESLERGGRREALFVPTDWPYGGDGRFGPDAFERVQAQISERYARSREPDAFNAHVDATFECLVKALWQCRTKKLFDWDVLLCVTSTDPSDRLVGLANKAVARINTATLTEEWGGCYGRQPLRGRS